MQAKSAQAGMASIIGVGMVGRGEPKAQDEWSRTNNAMNELLEAGMTKGSSNLQPGGWR